MDVAISRIHFPVTALGPGRRIGLWFQGCSIRCPGCISVDTWEAGLGLVPVAEVIARIATLAPQAEGLSVSGGEPFDQPGALAQVLTAWRESSNGSVLIFTGREFHDVKPWLEANPGLADALMTGPFRSDLPQRLALRGSDNQELHVLTQRGEEFNAFERPLVEADRKLDIMIDDDGNAWMAGIPVRGDVGRLRRSLAAAGHRAQTSDSRGPPVK
jgi:anaerobic ribonucleoside-triphosphate reductase activating protein